MLTRLLTWWRLGLARRRSSQGRCGGEVLRTRTLQTGSAMHRGMEEVCHGGDAARRWSSRAGTMRKGSRRRDRLATRKPTWTRSWWLQWLEDELVGVVVAWRRSAMLSRCLLWRRQAGDAEVEGMRRGEDAKVATCSGGWRSCWRGAVGIAGVHARKGGRWNRGCGLRVVASWARAGNYVLASEEADGRLRA